MSNDSGELLYSVLVRVAELVRRLPPDELEALAAGVTTLRVVAQAGTWAAPLSSQPTNPRAPVPVASASASPASAAPTRTQPRPDPPLPAPAHQIRAALAAMDDRAAAVAYLDGLRLSAAQLRALAKDLDIAVAAAASKSVVRDTLVRWTVGRRLDAALLGRPEQTRTT